MELSARAIYDKQFHDAWRGYDQKEVDDFLDRVAEHMDMMQRENAALKNRVRELDQAVSTSRDTEQMLKTTLASAQKASEEAIASAKAKAEQLINEAEARVTRANEEARTRMSSLEEEVRRRSLDAERDHAAKKRDLDATIDRLRSYEADLKQRLKIFLEQQLKALDGLVDDRPRPAARPDSAANASVAPAPGPVTQRPQAAPAGTRPVSREASPPGQLTARPAATQAGHAEAPPPAGDEDPDSDTAAPKRTLKGLFWGDES